MAASKIDNVSHRPGSSGRLAQFCEQIAIRVCTQHSAAGHAQTGRPTREAVNDHASTHKCVPIMNKITVKHEAPKEADLYWSA
jgi:hypothetical protein